MPTKVGLTAIAITLLLTVPTTSRAAEGEPAPPSKNPSFSLSLERVGGVSYTKLASSEDDTGGSLTAFGVASVNPNPYTATRLGADYILPMGLTLGAAGGFGRFSVSTTSARGENQDVGSLMIYTITPRVGYRLPVAPSFDVVPRAGLTLGGGSLDLDDGNTSYGVFAMALSAEVAGAFRLTDSFNLLGGLAFDHTLAASASATTTRTTVSTGTGTGSTTSTTSRTEDVTGALLSAQLWLGIGGYL